MKIFIKCVCSLSYDAIFEGIVVKIYRYNFEKRVATNKYELVIESGVPLKYKVGESYMLNLEMENNDEKFME